MSRLTETTPTRRIALVVLTREGLALALRVQQGLKEDEVSIYASQRVLKTSPHEAKVNALIYFASVRPLLTQLWETSTQIVLFFALGAAIRLIAPLLRDKRSDPGVVVIDDANKFVISVISGHRGGANDLTQQCASLLESISVVTTASDVQNTLAVDLLSEKMGWHIEDPSYVTSVSAAIVNKELVAILQEAGQHSWWENIHSWPGNIMWIHDISEVKATPFAALLVISDRLIEDIPANLPTVVYRPPSLVLGVGCQRGVSFSALDEFIRTTLKTHRLAFQSIEVLASADIKADEVALQELARHYSWRFETHPVADLKATPAIATPSERVQQLIGTPSVSEAAALLSSGSRQLIVCKQKGERMTLAVARRSEGGAVSTTLMKERGDTAAVVSEAEGDR